MNIDEIADMLPPPEKARDHVIIVDSALRPDIMERLVLLCHERGIRLVIPTMELTEDHVRNLMMDSLDSLFRDDTANMKELVLKMTKEAKIAHRIERETPRERANRNEPFWRKLGKQRRRDRHHRKPGR